SLAHCPRRAGPDRTRSRRQGPEATPALGAGATCPARHPASHRSWWAAEVARSKPLGKLRFSWAPPRSAFRENRRMLTVAVTGPPGEIGRAFISALERVPEVDRVIGMARRPFDLAGQGWEKTEYRRGDVLDREAVAALVEGADVVVHVAFAIVAGDAESRE